MPISLQAGESVLWDGRPVQSLSGIIMTLLTFVVADVVARYGPVGEAASVTLFILFFFLLFFTFYSILQLRRTRYYITNRRIIREQAMFKKKDEEMPLESLTNIRVSQSFPIHQRGIGNVIFDSGAGKPVEIVRVRDPQTVKQNALNAKAS